MTGDEQQQGVAQHFFAGQCALAFADGQHREQVVGRLADAGFHHRIDVVIQRGDSLVDARMSVGGFLVQGQQLTGQGAEELAVAARHTEPAGDNQHGHGVGEVGQ